jgi:hypothetical protein
MVKPWMVAGLGFGVVTAITRVIAGGVRKRREHAALKDEVQRWEGEGGQVPGGTIGAPAEKPSADHPQSYSATT